MNKLQRHIFKIVEYFDSFCKEEGIEYFLMGGSALGAARHKGFIPWDDDFDIFVTMENYLKLFGLKEKFENDSFCFQPINTDENKLFMGKVRMKNTLFIEGNGDNYDPRYCHGIYIDVMILFDCASGFFGRRIQFFYAKVLSAWRLANDGYKTKSLGKKLFMIFAKGFVGLFKEKTLFSFISRKRNKSKYLCHIFGRANFKKSFYPRQWFSNRVMINFETMQLPIMKNYDLYLRCRYGDNYMDMPSEKTLKQYPSHACYVNYDNENDLRGQTNEKI